MVLKAQHSRLTTPAVAGPVERGVSHHYLDENRLKFRRYSARNLDAQDSNYATDYFKS